MWCLSKSDLTFKQIISREKKWSNRVKQKVHDSAYHLNVGAGKPEILATNFTVPCSGATKSFSGCVTFGAFTAVNKRCQQSCNACEQIARTHCVYCINVIC